jgi:threonine aldolase
MHARASLVCLENTHNAAGGIAWPIEALADATDYVKREGLHCHLDGARLWNACAAKGYTAKDCSNLFDSVSVCFSKGLGAPIGSAIAGPADWIEEARWVRHRLGAGMRQVGIIAAAAIYALDHHMDRLYEDHENARIFAGKLSELSGVDVNPGNVETNIVRFKIPSGKAFALAEACRKRGLAINPGAPDAIRAVFHLGVSREETLTAFDLLEQSLNEIGG